ncbi:related to lipase/esterase [Cephalotrichum gorgonifer]|uniref:Related to lipase/esterase n=1 Tax=Cephalotrichum gorgonifer TaxID=2041049 RepID=A0AAE8SUU3_9PEZI|nr:related to lipase/esterase [Cephalotrichum gorgonifer]
MALRFDPEFQAAMSAQPPRPRSSPPQTVFDIRTGTNTALTTYFATLPVPPTITETRLSIPGPSGDPLLLIRHTPASAAAAPSPQPAVVYVHGGGMVSGSADLVGPEVAMLADEAGISFFAVGYRLAPEHPAPAGVEDAYAAVQYISSHAAELGIDASRIALLGISGGGAVAAGAALLARDRGLSPPLAKLVLVYPMLDDRTVVPPESPLYDFLSWGAVNNRLAWEAVLGADKAGKADADVSPYAAPGRATDLAGLPRTYIDCGSLDLFAQENIAFAGKLAAANVEVELHIWPGLPHGFEGMSEIHWTKTAQASRRRAIRSLLDAE